MAVKVLGLTVLLWTLTACQQGQLSLTVAQAAGAESPSASPSSPSLPAAAGAPQPIRLPEPDDSCYAFIPLRPRQQRARAVQDRLEKADQISAALDSRTFSVDLIGDHANILSLQFPVAWPGDPSYSHRVSEIVEHYFTDPDVEDDLCNSGFAEVRLSARGLNDHRIHPLWSARITSEGLLRAAEGGEELVTTNMVSLP